MIPLIMINASSVKIHSLQLMIFVWALKNSFGRSTIIIKFSAIRNLRLKTLLSPVPARTDSQPRPVVHASSTDIYIHYTSCMPEVPVSTCVRLSPVPMCLTVHFFYRLTDFVQKAKPLTFDIQGCIDISIMLCTTVWARPLSNTQIL